LLPHALDQILRMQSVSLYLKIELSLNWIDYHCLYALSSFMPDYFVYFL
jgi:hypothetical protein